MKIAVIKLGARIMWETDAAVGPGEAISICKALKQGGAEVHVFTKILQRIRCMTLCSGTTFLTIAIQAALTLCS